MLPLGTFTIEETTAPKLFAADPNTYVGHITQNGEEAKAARDLLTSLSEYFLYVARDNEKVSSDPDFFEIANNIDEQEKIYRQHLVLYNADVLGYNFWISFFLTRYIYKILKRKTKDIIS